MISKTVCITQEGPANALALNKDNSQVVIAGRNGRLFNNKDLLLIFYKSHIIILFIVASCIEIIN